MCFSSVELKVYSEKVDILTNVCLIYVTPRNRGVWTQDALLDQENALKIEMLASLCNILILRKILTKITDIIPT